MEEVTMSGYERQQDNIQELREQAAKLQQAGSEVDSLLARLRGEIRTLGEDWNDPAATEIQGIIAGVFQQTHGISDLLNNLAQQFQDKSDEAEQAERTTHQQSSADESKDS